MIYCARLEKFKDKCENAFCGKPAVCACFFVSKEYSGIYDSCEDHVLSKDSANEVEQTSRFVAKMFLKYYQDENFLNRKPTIITLDFVNNLLK